MGSYLSTNQAHASSLEEEEEHERKSIFAKLAGRVEEGAHRIRVERAIKGLGVSSGSEEILREMSSPVTNFFLANFPGQLITAKEAGALSNLDIDFIDDKGEQKFSLGWKEVNSCDKSYDKEWKKEFIPAVSNTLAEGVTINRIAEDTFDGAGVPLPAKILQKLTKSATIFPNDDNIVFFMSREEADTYLKDLKLVNFDEGGCAPVPYNDWGDMTSDESVPQLFFRALGATHLELQTGPSSRPELGVIEVNMDFMADYDVRDAFRPYGATVYFDKNQKLTAIYDPYKKTVVKPGDDAWEATKFLAKTSGFVLGNVRKHLTECHCLASNSMSKSSLKNLPPNHPIRRLLNVFTYRANATNNDAVGMVVSKRGLVERFTGFASMDQAYKGAYEASNVFEPFPKRSLIPELLEMSKCGNLPYHKDGCEYYDIVATLVTKWLKCAGDSASDEYAKAFYDEIKADSVGQKYEIPDYDGDDSMIALISQCIFAVTAWHEMAGNLIDYTNDPFGCGGRVVDGATSCDVQGFTTGLIVTASTGGTVPMLMTDYANYFGEDGAPAWERMQWDAFICDLKAQSKKVQGSRSEEFKLFDPANMESSVSV